MKSVLVKWLKWALFVTVPLTVVGLVLQSSSLERWVNNSATKAVVEGGFDWPEISVSGRDITLSGEAKSQDIIDAASSTIYNTYGVRQVSSVATIKLPVILDEPTVTPYSGSDGSTISGTWPSAKPTETLAVTVAGSTYTFGKSTELVTDVDSWKVLLENPLSDGTYDVAVTVTDGDDASASDVTRDEIIIDTVPPELPTVNWLSGANPRPTITENWPAKDAANFEVTVDDVKYIKDTSPELSSNADGTWSLIPRQDLVIGLYDVKAVVQDSAGNSASDATFDEIRINQNCEAVLNSIIQRERILFEFNKHTIGANGKDIIKYLVAAATRCPDSNITVVGHADDVGSVAYNQRLSERRAKAVVKALIDQGMNSNRLRSRGEGELNPDESNDNEANRAKNRRIEFLVDE